MARKDHPDAHTRLVISRIISLTTGPELVPSIAWEDQTVKQPVSVYRPLYCRFALQIYMEWIKWQQVRIYSFRFFVCQDQCDAESSFALPCSRSGFHLTFFSETALNLLGNLLSDFNFPTLPAPPCCDRKTKRICQRFSSSLARWTVFSSCTFDKNCNFSNFLSFSKEPLVLWLHRAYQVNIHLSYLSL